MAKPGEYSDYFLNELAIIRRSFEPINFYDLTYKFKASRFPSSKVRMLFLKAYMMVLWF